MIINTFPKECTLLEWNEQQQDFHFNEVSKGNARTRPNTHGWLVIHICKDHDEAYTVAEYLKKYIQGKTGKSEGRIINAAQMTRQVKAAIKFASAYNKIKGTSLK